MKKQPSLLQSIALFALLAVTPFLHGQNVFSFETNTTDWQSQSSTGTWSNAIAGSPSTGFPAFVLGKGFTGTTAANFIWGSTYSSGTKPGYSSSAQDSFINRSATFAKFKRPFTLPDSICKIDSARISLICDDGIDSVWVNNTLVLTTPILFYGLNYVTVSIPVNLLSSTNNVLTVRAVDYFGNHALYAKLNVYYKTQGNCCTAIVHPDSLDIESNTSGGWESKNASGVWGSYTAASTSNGFGTLVQSKGFTNATTANFIWGDTYTTGIKQNYNSSSNTTFDNTNASFVLFRNQFTLPDSVCNIDSARVWMICDDGIDSAWINNTLVANTPILFYGVNYVTASIPGNLFTTTNNEIKIRAVDYFAYYGLYTKLRIYYKKGNCCVTTSIDGSTGSELDAFNVYPTPTKDLLFIDTKVADKSNLSYEMVNAIGQSVIPTVSILGESKTVINTGFLQNGIYFLRLIQNGKVVQVKKVVIE